MLRDRIVRPLVRALGSSTQVKVAAWSICLRLLGALLSFAIGIQLARYMGPAGLGIYGVVLGAAMLLGTAAQLGLPTLSVRELSVRRAQQRGSTLQPLIFAFASITGVCGLLLGAGLALVGPSFAPPGTDYRIPFVVGGFIVPLSAGLMLVGSSLRGLDRLVQGQSLDIVIRPALMSVILFVVHFSSERMSAEIALASSSVAYVLALAIGTVWLLQAAPQGGGRVEGSRGEMAGWLRAAAPLAGVDLFRQLDGVYGILVVGAVSTAAEAGLFRVAASTAIILAMPCFVLHVTLAPRLARLHASGDIIGLQSTFATSACVMFGSVVAGLMPILFFGQQLITGLFGAEFAGSWPPLLMLIGAYAVSAFFGVGSIYLAMADGQGRLWRCSALTACTCVFTAVPLASWWGASGAAASAIIGHVAGNLLAWHYVRRSTGLDSSVMALIQPRSGSAMLTSRAELR